MRQTNRTSRAAFALAIVAALLATAAPLWAQDAAPRFRTGVYGRGGAEIWGEVPRFGVPVGKGYSGEYDVSSGAGFGFGLMLGFSDKLAVEGRMAQTKHKTPDDRSWDIDQYFVGMRYTFRHEKPLQPFLAVGGARLSLEWTDRNGGLSDFERLWGYGAYGTVGLDYVMSSRWAVGIRADYVWSRYTRANIGTEESDLEDALDSSMIGLSLCLHYRVPVYW
jgi:hypothetical protein